MGNSHVNVTVIPDFAVSWESTAVGSSLKEVIVGRTEYVNITIRDEYGNVYDSDVAGPNDEPVYIISVETNATSQVLTSTLVESDPSGKFFCLVLLCQLDTFWNRLRLMTILKA